MRAFVSCDISGLSRSARETVLAEKPVACAISFMVMLFIASSFSDVLEMRENAPYAPLIR
jgi:hypothetical protein